MKQYVDAFLPLLLIATRSGKKNCRRDSPFSWPNAFFLCIQPPFVYSRPCTFLIPAITRLAGHVRGRFARSQWMSQYSQRCDEPELHAGEKGACGETCCLVRRQIFCNYHDFRSLLNNHFVNNKLHLTAMEQWQVLGIKRRVSVKVTFNSAERVKCVCVWQI